MVRARVSQARAGYCRGLRESSNKSEFICKVLYTIALFISPVGRERPSQLTLLWIESA